MMTLEDLEEALEELFPNGFELTTDDDGQIVILTGLMQDEDGELVEFESDDDEEEEEEEDFDSDEDEEDDE
jgi:hypothetical protein